MSELDLGNWEPFAPEALRLTSPGHPWLGRL